MSDMTDGFRALTQHRKDLRATFGVRCPECAKARPKAHPSILLPQQRCRLDGYIDPRPELTQHEWSNP